jgi:hypothetical protein
MSEGESGGEPAAERPSGSRAAIAGLSIACLCIWAALDRWQRQPDPVFAVDGIPLLAWYALGVLTLAGVMRWISRPRPTFRAMLMLALGAVPVPLLLVGAIAFYLEQPWTWWAGAACLCLLIYFLRGLAAITGRPQRSAALVGVSFVAAFMWSSDSNRRTGSMRRSSPCSATLRRTRSRFSWGLPASAIRKCSRRK